MALPLRLALSFFAILLMAWPSEQYGPAARREACQVLCGGGAVGRRGPQIRTWPEGFFEPLKLPIKIGKNGAVPFSRQARVPAGAAAAAVAPKTEAPTGPTPVDGIQEDKDNSDALTSTEAPAPAPAEE